MPLLFLLVGCWDGRELNTLFIITGIALDESKEKENMIDISIQGIKTTADQPSSSGSSGDDTNTVIFKLTEPTVKEALFRVALNNNRAPFLQHNQVILIGESLAKKGVKGYLDFFIREQESRLETIVLIVEGRADEILELKIKQEPNSALYFSTLMNSLNKRANYYRVSILHFISQLLSEGQSAIVPILKKNDIECDLPIKLIGMSIFQDDKMKNLLINEEVVGYLWAMGKVNISTQTIKEPEAKGTFNFNSVKTQQKLLYEGDRPVKITFTIETTVQVEELDGFYEYSQLELVEALNKFVQKEMVRLVTKTFEKCQEHKTDIYGIGASIYQKHPKKWKKIHEDWENIFSELEFEVIAKPKITDYGQVLNLFGKGSQEG